MLCIVYDMERRLLGHEVEPVQLRATLPKRMSAPGLPELNHSQVQITLPPWKVFLQLRQP